MSSINYIAFKTIVHREVSRFMRIWSQTLLPPAITMALYFLIFGRFIGPRIGAMHGVTYIQYIVPGLIMMSLIMNAYSNVTTSLFGTKFQKNIDEMLIAPISNHIILGGFLIGGVLRGVLVGIIVMGIALCFTHLKIHNGFLIIFVGVCSSFLFSLAGFTNGLFANHFDDVSIIPTFVLTPLTYLGGVFYSMDQLSPFWRGVSVLNPIVYMVNAFRYGMLGISDVNIYGAMGVIIIFSIALYGFNLFLMNKGYGLRT